MNKERLEEIKERYTEAILNDGYFNDLINITTKDYMWLIEQAEQAEGLKVKAKKLKEEKQKFMLSATKQRKQKQLYREALKQIEGNTDGSIRNTARKALEESE